MEDFPAFIVNRILLPMINEAIYTLYEGVGTVEAIDTAMKLADFKVRHANVWIPRFFTRVAEKAEHEFYLTAADLGTFLCEVDSIEDEAPKAQ